MTSPKPGGRQGGSVSTTGQALLIVGRAAKEPEPGHILGTVRGACTERRALGLWTAGSVKKVLTNKATTALLAQQAP